MVSGNPAHQDPRRLCTRRLEQPSDVYAWEVVHSSPAPARPRRHTLTMPIYEYACLACGHQFEHFLLPTAKIDPACPECQSHDLERLLSGFALSTRDLTKARVKAARKQIAQNKDTKDKQIAETEYVRHHMEDHLPPAPKPKKT